MGVSIGSCFHRFSIVQKSLWKFLFLEFQMNCGIFTLYSLFTLLHNVETPFRLNQNRWTVVAIIYFIFKRRAKEKVWILNGFSCVNGFLWNVMIACCVVWFIRFVVEDKAAVSKKKWESPTVVPAPTFEISCIFFCIFFFVWFCIETCNEKIEFIEKYERSTIYLLASDARNVWCCMGHVTFKVKHYLWIILFRGGKCLTAAYNFAASFTERCIVDFYPTRFFRRFFSFFFSLLLSTSSKNGKEVYTVVLFLCVCILLVFSIAVAISQASNRARMCLADDMCWCVCV